LLVLHFAQLYARVPLHVFIVFSVVGNLNHWFVFVYNYVWCLVRWCSCSVFKSAFSANSQTWDVYVMFLNFQPIHKLGNWKDCILLFVTSRSNAYSSKYSFHLSLFQMHVTVDDRYVHWQQTQDMENSTTLSWISSRGLCCIDLLVM